MPSPLLHFRDDTIAAIATPPGQGGVGVVRLSGPQSRAALVRIFRPSSATFTDFLPRHLHHGHVLDASGRVVDDCLAVFFPGPYSFTGEDVAELQCHGGGAILRAVLESLLATGLVRPAAAGEFSRRAFLNGKLDLAQAEAVAEAIAAPTAAAARLAQDRLSGALSRHIDHLRETLESLKRDCCLAVDFPEDEVDCLPPDLFRQQLATVRQAVAGLAAQHRRTRAWREGALVVLAGRVNAGKSSLLNALLGRQRAIVSHTPGTTRDYLEESLLLDGMAVRLVDTAGLREAGEIIPGGQDGAEAQGIARSRELMDGADLVLVVMDALQAARLQADNPERSLLADSPERALLDRLGDRAMLVWNKSDLLEASTAPAVPHGLRVSAATGEGLEALAAALSRRLQTAALEPRPGELTPNLRQSLLLQEADAELDRLEQEHAAGLPCDLLAVRLDSAIAHLAEITGAITSQAILDQIFSSFCIGK